MFWFNITTDLDPFLYSSYSLPANKSAISLSLSISLRVCVFIMLTLNMSICLSS